MWAGNNHVIELDKAWKQPDVPRTRVNISVCIMLLAGGQTHLLCGFSNGKPANYINASFMCGIEYYKSTVHNLRSHPQLMCGNSIFLHLIINRATKEAFTAVFPFV